MKKLILLLLGFLAIFTYMRAIDSAEAEEKQQEIIRANSMEIVR
jgi:hypothetical protein